MTCEGAVLEKKKNQEHRNKIELEDFSVRIAHGICWGDMDAFGHVNNTVFFRYFENARIEYLRQMGLGLGDDVSIRPILAQTDCTFIRPIVYPDSICIGARVESLGTHSFYMTYGVYRTPLQECMAVGRGKVVSFDYRTGRKVPLPQEWKNGIGRIERGSVDVEL